ncbi:MAG: hypothetical protein M1269_05380 [Chloroflexi bacterium]|nr:hypothetical protein [Chloroflexota bacterium]
MIWKEKKKAIITLLVCMILIAVVVVPAFKYFSKITLQKKLSMADAGITGNRGSYSTSINKRNIPALREYAADPGTKAVISRFDSLPVPEMAREADLFADVCIGDKTFMQGVSSSPVASLYSSAFRPLEKIDPLVKERVERGDSYEEILEDVINKIKVSNRPVPKEAATAWAGVLFSQGKTKEAAEVVNKYIKKDEQDNRLFGMIFFDLQDNPGSMQVFMRAITREPENYPDMGQSLLFYAKNCISLAHNMPDVPENSAVRIELLHTAEKILEGLPNKNALEEAYIDLQAVYSGLAELYSKQGDNAGAKKYRRKVEEVSPLPLMSMGELYLFGRSMEDGERYFNAALTIESKKNKPGGVLTGICRDSLEEIKKLRENYKGSEQAAGGKELPGHFTRVFFLLKSGGRYEEAEEYLMNALKICETDRVNENDRTYKKLRNLYNDLKK